MVVGEKEYVYREHITVKDVNWLTMPPEDALPAQVKVRYNHPAAEAWVVPLAEGRARIEFRKPQEAPSPGQAAVFYWNDKVLGGGTIEDVSPER